MTYRDRIIERAIQHGELTHQPDWVQKTVIALDSGMFPSFIESEIIKVMREKNPKAFSQKLSSGSQWSKSELVGLPKLTDEII